MSATLAVLAQDVQTFLAEVIPQEPGAPARKLVKEAIELAEDPSLAEAADVLICLLGWTGLNGFSPADLIEAANAKMKVNLGRTWVRCEDGTYQHST